MDIDGLRLPMTGVIVIWKWRCLRSEMLEQDSDESIPSDESSSTSTTDEEGYSEPEDERQRSEKIVFKCIGSTRDTTYQTALRGARDNRLSGCNVPVKLVHEASNPYDSRAIAFKCELGGKWYTIGYVVSELLEEVHAAIDSDSIVSVEFAWVRYITDWTRSGPGFFAGVAVEKKGQWSDNARRAASTR